MSEELHDVRLVVNGVTHEVSVPARRLLSDALRHDLGLTGTHVGCEHGVCGACTILVDGRPMRSCLMFAVSAADCEITTVEGLTNADGSLSPVQQAFAECHGLQCGFCTPGFLTTITAGLRDNPEPDARRGAGHDRRQPLPLHRLPEHRQGGRTSGSARRGAGMTTKLMGTKVQRVEDQRLLRGQGRYVDDVAVGPGTLHAAVLRSPHAHARIVDIDVDEVLELEGVHAVWTYDDLGDLSRTDGRAAAVADPAPRPDPWPHAVRAGARRGQLHGRGDRVRGRRRPLHRRGRGRPDQGRLRATCLRSSASRPPAPPTTWCTTTCPATSARGWSRTPATSRSAIAAAPHRMSLDLTIERSACMPMEGRGTVARWDARQRPAAGVDLDPDLDRRPRRGRGQARPRPRPGRRDHARRRRRLRRQDQPPVARGGARPAGRAHARPHREVHRGPARALHLLGPRARPGPPRRRRASTTTAGWSAWT